jgi:DNA-binding transcriptional ArsR family regulator
MSVAAASSDVFRAVADPTRRAMLDLLRESDRSVRELARPFRMSQPAISQHLRVLREVGLVRARDEGRQRIYRIDASALKPIHDWVQRYEEMWSERYDRLDAVLEELKREEERGDGADDE